MKNITNILKLIQILSDGKYYSIKKLSKILKINPIFINNYIFKIEKLGLIILQNSEKKYRFFKPIQLININFIRSLLKENNKIYFIPIINSTNQYLMDKMNILKSGDVCISECQLTGRGRFGRIWISPFGMNIYLSMYWKLNCVFYHLKGISIAVSIAIAELLKYLGIKSVKIKWPNDVYLNNKKLAGVLVEIINKNSHNMQNIIIGIGINCSMNLYNLSLINQNWTNLDVHGINLNRNLLIVMLIKKLKITLLTFEKTGLFSFLKKWKSLDIYLNKNVKVMINNHAIFGIARGINIYGEFLLENNSTISAWHGEQISICKY